MHCQHFCVMVRLFWINVCYIFVFILYSLSLSLSLSLSVLLFLVFLEVSVDLESVINSVWIDIVLEVLLCGAESFCFDSWFNKESITLSFLLICSFRKAMFSSNKMINLSELFDLLTLSVVYDVSNCFLKTFTSARNDFLNVRKSSKKLSSDLLESLSIAFALSVTSFSFIISQWYYLSSLLPVRTTRLLSLYNWDSFGSDKQVLFPSTFSFTACFSVNRYRRLSKISLEISFSSELLTDSKTSSFPHFLLLRLSVFTEAMMSASSSSFSIFSGGTWADFTSIHCYLLVIAFLLTFPF